MERVVKGMTQLRLTNISDVPNLSDIWRSLEPHADGGVFLSWHWIGPWLAHLDPADCPLLVEIRQDEGLIALALLCEQARHRVHRLSNRAVLLNETGNPTTNYVIEYNGLLTRRGFETVAAEAMLDHFLAQGAWDELILSGIRADDAMLRSRLTQDRLIVDVTNSSPSWYVDLDAIRATGGDVISQLSSNTRYQLRKALRGLEQQGPLVIDCATTPEEAEGYFSGLKQLHQAWWESKGKPGSFARPQWERFHRALIRDGFADGVVQMMRFRAGDAVIGYLYNLVHDGRVSMIQSGYDYGSFNDFHPGYVCNYLALTYNLEHGNAVYDFLAGDARYKRSLAKASNELCWVALRKKTWRNRLEQRLLPWYRRLK